MTDSNTLGLPAASTLDPSDEMHIVQNVAYTPLDCHVPLSALGAFLSISWPIGSIFMAVVATSPATLLGFGTWARFAEGKVLVGRNNTSGTFNVAAETTGGEETHTLSAGEVAAHSHGVKYTTGTGADYTVHLLGTTGGGGLAATEAAGVDIVNSAAGGAHNNLQPYIVVYMWKRVS